MADCCDCPAEVHGNRAGIGLLINFKHCVDGDMVPRPLQASDTVRVYVKPEKGDVSAKQLTASIEDEAGGVIKAVTVSDTLDVVDEIWKIWGEIDRDGSTFTSRASKFLVFEN